MPIYKGRPTCAELLSAYNTWAINEAEVKNSNEYKTLLKDIKSDQDPFFIQYIKAKLQD